MRSVENSPSHNPNPNRATELRELYFQKYQSKLFPEGGCGFSDPGVLEEVDVLARAILFLEKK
ncbi:MAG: hypothetical protein M1372_01735 [Patescibacteria group bacterium]|nr:hypothetical protein [Patescibacteria group bacterium]MCL5113870.1 hypothetical protein [Patescibacteria group bacterium]